MWDIVATSLHCQNFTSDPAQLPLGLVLWHGPSTPAAQSITTAESPAWSQPTSATDAAACSR